MSSRALKPRIPAPDHGKIQALESCPLAKAYGWEAPRHDTGGILYLVPPVTKHNTDSTANHKATIKRARPFAIAFEDYAPLAATVAKAEHERIKAGWHT